MESRAGANMQQNDEKSVEKLMDEHLRANGLHRKKIAKDGSCLFRAVAEQVLHCQGLHTRVRAECVKYLRQNRDLYESFIEGDFEEYLHMLQDPQSWVGQVEISALAVLYKHDFIIYQQPGEPPVNITENGYSDKVLLCFLNGNHYDSVYPISSVKNAAMCQSILYELLYERVYGVDRSVITPSLRVSRAKSEIIETEERESSGNSDLDEGEDFWSSEVTGRPAGVSNRTAYKGRGRGQARGVGRGCLLRKVQDSLSPSLFRNVEYEAWLRSKRVQQRRDFCMAAGMHYKAGDKCEVRLNNTDRFYSAYIQDVSPDDGPVTVFIEELGEKYSVPLWNLRTPSEDSWTTVTEKSKRQTASSSNGPTERDANPGRKPVRSVSHGPTESSGSAPGNRVQQQHSWPPQATIDPQSLGKNGSSRRSDQGAGGSFVPPVEENEQALLELLNKDEENFPTLEASAQAASVEGSRRVEKKGSRKKASTDTKEQSLNPVHKAEKGKPAKRDSVDHDQRISPPPKEEPNPTPSTTLPAPSAPKSTKAAPVSTIAPGRVPYKSTSSLSARIPPIQSQTTPPPSTRPSVSFQTTPIQSPTAPDPSTRPPDSFQTTPIQSPTAPAPSTRPIVLFENTPVEFQAALEPSEVVPVSSQTTLVQPQTLPLPAISVPTPVSSQCTPTHCLTMPKLIPGTTPALPQNSSQTIQSQVLDPTAPVTTPVPLNPVREATTTPIPSQMNTTPLSPVTPAPNPVSTPLSSPSSFQTSPAPTHALSQTTSATTQGPVPAPSPITSAAEVPGSSELSAASKSPPAETASEQSDPAGVPTPVHVPNSITSPAQLAPSLAPSYSVGFGPHLHYPPYPLYPGPVPSLSPNISAPMPDPGLPPALPTPPFSHAAESYLYEPAVLPVAADPPPQQSVTLAQLCQDMLYPGFPQNDKDEPAQLPPFSHDNTGKDLPSGTIFLICFTDIPFPQIQWSSCSW